MLSEDQFVKIIDKITDIKADHDLLVTISTNIEGLNRMVLEERDRTCQNISRIEASVNAAHKRIDKLDKFNFVSIGAFGSLVAIVAIVTFLLQLAGKL